ncbi:hypothetical protein B0A49_08925 [Cryomyces minteri]|uniref:Uncharacterized protein n=1 Tax=Cryomyces minteri TaxID=331657 RepID=A0A4U0WAY0_9PEZI|nr:hypothetical protein B0A49_08925 [Cryomyces minteri]
MAVHMDEEAAITSASSSSASPTTSQKRPKLEHSDSWLGRQEKKRSRRACICWSFWISFFGFIAAIVIAVLWLVRSGTLADIKIG